MANKINGQTLCYTNPPQIVGYASIVGPEEGKGPYGKKFDQICNDVKCGKDTWEKGEKKMVADAIDLAMGKASVSTNDIDFMLGGDLLNQIVTANFVARDYDLPFLGLYSACATMIEGLIVSSTLLDGEFADCVLAFASSNYQTAERQYRTPLEYGDQYPGYKQWTITGAGAYILGKMGGDVCITHGTFGKVMDLGVVDPNDMGSAMAPAAAETIIQNFTDLSRGPQDYDLIITGDLGCVGRKILNELLEEKDIKLGKKLKDCGEEILKGNKKCGSGGSGVAATAVFIGSVLIPRMISGELNRILIIGTGALLNTVTVKQNESIPAVAHGIALEKVPGGMSYG